MRFKKIFISDLHLDYQVSDKNELFINSCDWFAKNTDELYILGDFWVVWLGDDSLDYPSWQSGFAKVANALSELAQKIKVYFMVGNRDFAVAERFYKTCNLIPIADPYKVLINGQNVLLSHGDGLCVDDIAYMQSKKMIRSPEFMQMFLTKPMEERIKMLGTYEREDDNLIDINFAHSKKLMQEHQSKLLIHGHIHKPQNHDLGDGLHRYVLHNWDEQAGMLGINDESFKLYDLDYINNQITIAELK